MLEGVAGVLVAIGTLLGSVGALVLTLRNGRKQAEAKEAAVVAAQAAEAAKNEITVINGQIRQLGIAVDGRLSKLIEQIELRALAEGKALGKAEEAADEKGRKNGEAAKASRLEGPAAPIDVKIVDTKGHVPVVVKESKKG